MKWWVALAWVFAALPAQAGWPPLPETTERISVGANSEEGPYNCCPQVSADGRYVLFLGTSLDHPLSGLLLKDRQNGAVERVCRNAQGELANQHCEIHGLSADGRYILLRTRATNMGAVPPFPLSDFPFTFVRDRITGMLWEIRLQIPGCNFCSPIGTAVLSADGRSVVLAWQVPGQPLFGQIYQVNVESGAFAAVSVHSNGQFANASVSRPALSGSGRYVVFTTTANNLGPSVPDTSYGHLVRKDLLTGEIRLVSSASDGSFANDSTLYGAINFDGRHVAFISVATNLTPDPPTSLERLYQVFLKDMETGAITLVSRATSGGRGNGNSLEPVVSSDGRRVAFRSFANNLTSSDTNGPASDVFVWTQGSDYPRLISVSNEGVQGSSSNGYLFSNPPTPIVFKEFSPVMSADGLSVAYHSHSANLVADDFNQAPDVFVRNLAPLGVPPQAPPLAVPLRSALALALLVLALLMVAARRSRPGARSEG